MPSSSRPVSRYQRRILAWGVGVACLLYVVGAPIYLSQVEDDLTERVTAELVAAGYDGFAVSFSGQTGRISCDRPLADPQEALDLAYDVRGVRAMDDLPAACRVRQAVDEAEEPPATAADTTTTTVELLIEFPPSSTSSTTSVPADFASVADIIGGNPQFSLLFQLVQDAELAADLSGEEPVTLFAPTDAAFDALPADSVALLRSDPALLERVLRHHLVGGLVSVADLVAGELATTAGDVLVIGAGPTVDDAAIVEGDVMAANGVVHAVDRVLVPSDVDLSPDEPVASVTATYADGRIVLQGTVRSEVERSVVIDAASSAVGAEQVDDQLAVDPDIGLGETNAAALATLVSAMPTTLLNGVAGFDGEALYVTGTFVDPTQRDALLAVASEVGAQADLTAPPEATDDDAVDLEAELNDFVADNPILFEPSSSQLDQSATPILDEIARRLREFSGVAITVEGHTDSDGGAQENLVLSQLRAIAVQDALVERGIDPTSVTAEGFGSTRPILVDGVEDKAASRRVEFRVVVS